MILEVRQFWENLEKKKITTVARNFGISSPTAKRYIQMSASEIENMDSPKNYKKRDSPMNKWLNVIFKMMLDGHSDETIYFYIREQEDFTESMEQLARYIYLIGKNNFPGRIPFNAQYLIEYVIPPDVICFKRMEILKYLLTCGPKVQKNKELDKYIDLIKENFPAALYAETVFKEFRTILMGNEPEKLDGFLEKYSNGCLAAFCNGIKKDIAPVKNAISHPESSGFVEGNNNKFKLIKRIVYGRSGLVNLEKKCKLAFMPKTGKFNLQALV